MGPELMAKLLLYLASLMLSTNFSASTPPTPAASVVSMSYGAVATAAPHEATDESVRTEQRLIDLVNSERRAKGLTALALNPLLVQVARDHSREMWEKGYFDHFSPTPELRTPMDRYIKALGRTPTWAFLGENLFYCSIVDVDRGHRLLMQSPKHRENITNDRFREIGVGVFVSPDGQFYVTQLFLGQTN